MPAAVYFHGGDVPCEPAFLIKKEGRSGASVGNGCQSKEIVEEKKIILIYQEDNRLHEKIEETVSGSVPYSGAVFCCLPAQLCHIGG